MRPIFILILLAGAMYPCPPMQADETPPDTKPAKELHAVKPDMLSLIPAAAELAIAIPSLALFDVQAASTLNRLGRSASAGVLTPVLDWLEIVEGVDRSRSAALVIWPTNKHGQSHMTGAAEQAASRRMALFIPTDSLENLIRFHSPSPTGSGVFRVTIRGRPAWVTQTAGHAIFATDQNTLRAIQQSSRALRDELTPGELHRWAANELVVFGNPSAGQPGTTLLSLSPSIAPWLASVADSMQRASRWSCAVRFENDGLTMEVITTSLATKGNQSALTATESGLLGIPLEPIACAVRVRDAHAVDSHVIPLVDLLAPDQSSKAGSGTSHWHKATRNMLRELDGFSFSVSNAGSAINAAVTAKVRATPRQLRNTIESVVKGLGEGGFTNPRMNQILSLLALKPGVESASGVTIDHLVLNTDSIEGLNRQGIMDAFGAEGLTMRLAIVDDRYLVATLGGGMDRFLGVVNAVRSGRSPIEANARVIRAAKHLGKNGLLGAYVSPNRLSSLRQTMARLIENSTDEPSAERPAELVGLSADTGQGNGYRIRLFLPDDALAGLLSPLARSTARKSPR